MGSLSRFKDIMASNVNALIDKSRNPEKTINEYMNQLRSDLGHVKGELAALETTRDRAARELNECESELEKYERYAEKASQDGNSADARLYEQKKDLCVLRALGFRYSGISLRLFSQSGIYFAFSCLIGIPAGLYAVKFFKPDTYEKYESAAAFRIMVVGLIMPLAICAFYLFGGYKPMMWIAAMAAVSWLFTKPTLGKMEQEMKP